MSVETSALQPAASEGALAAALEAIAFEIDLLDDDDKPENDALCAIGKRHVKQGRLKELLSAAQSSHGHTPLSSELGAMSPTAGRGNSAVRMESTDLGDISAADVKALEEEVAALTKVPRPHCCLTVRTLQSTEPCDTLRNTCPSLYLQLHSCTPFRIFETYLTLNSLKCALCSPVTCNFQTGQGTVGC